MADTKLSALTALAVEMDDADEIYINDGGTSKKQTYAVFKAAFEPVKGADDNYVTDAEAVVIGNTSGANTGDQSQEGTAVLSTGETGGTKVLQEDGDDSSSWQEPFERRDIAFSDETSDLTTGDNKATFHMPNYATTLLEVSVGMTDAPTDAAAIFDLTEAGTTVLSTLITVDATTKTSEDAGTPPVISDSALAANALMSVNVDQVGSTLTGKGGKLYLKYRRA
jgi:hypothetical protein